MPLASPFTPHNIAPMPTQSGETLHLRADFSARAVVRPEDYQWTDSPNAGVTRMMLDRQGNEVARATSLVHYAPGNQFTQHTHHGGEELYVLAGEFADEHGRYPAGSYVRNPIGTQHSPFVGKEGATLFVKLHQFTQNYAKSVNIFTPDEHWSPSLVSGLSALPLHQHEHEQVALVRWAPRTRFKRHKHWSGEEILVLSGVFRDEHGIYPVGSWLRSPYLSEHSPYTGDEGALIYVKTGHLPPRNSYADIAPTAP